MKDLRLSLSSVSSRDNLCCNITMAGGVFGLEKNSSLESNVAALATAVRYMTLGADLPPCNAPWVGVLSRVTLCGTEPLR